jgi:hypothetical protein
LDEPKFPALPSPPGGESWTLRNPQQRWAANFDGHGFTVLPDAEDWQWGLELTGYETLFVTEGKDRITYARSPQLDEWFVNRPEGLDHGFTLHWRSGAINLRLNLRGEPDRNAILYTGLSATDALGRDLPAALDRLEGAVRIRVDDRGARYPITIRTRVRRPPR